MALPRKRWRAAAALGLAVTAGSSLAVGAAEGQPSTVGTDGYVHVAPNGVVLGVDPYYPEDGNGGYDVGDYNVALDYDPRREVIAAKATIRATTTQQLSRFNLDLRGLTVRSVTVDGAPARFTRAKEHELVITPAAVLAEGAAFTVVVDYFGSPTPIRTESGVTGWRRSHFGGVFAVGAPHSALTWLPLNDTSVDRATFRVSVTAPAGYTVVSNGVRSSQTAATTTWTEDRPISPNALMLAVGPYRLTETALPGGVRATHATSVYSPNGSALAAALPKAVEFLTSKLGDYPQGTAGGVYVADYLPDTFPAQGRPVLGPTACADDVMYATAAQWWGNRVGIKMWKDLPLVESFARYTVWMWDAERAGVDIEDRYQRAFRSASPAFWNRKLSDPGRGRELSVSDKGVLMVHALRKQIGEDAFLAVLRGFPEINDNWPQGWHDWELYTEAVADQDLHDFFAAWVDGTTVPPTVVPPAR
ncbi:M1 family metallopeptidase [Actinokineospora sp. NBRC 105648]|uniref:M1 family metallopeptidase n=1 Tax=Actinokineospora sp. NBRC 105648 TaxID=3032206 RepID=UPI0024A08578|nr:M1 family metallopeptidase [Actinokineospora sp. NBRC 105648]GLZ36936.1 peptidase [Actinokineospora sp. NBRC 105648]